MVVKGANHNQGHTTTGSDGGYNLTLWPDTYEIGVEPPSGDPNGFTVKSGVVVDEEARLRLIYRGDWMDSV